MKLFILVNIFSSLLWAGECLTQAGHFNYARCVEEKMQKAMAEVKVHDLNELTHGQIEPFLPNTDYQTWGQSQKYIFKVTREGERRIIKVIDRQFAFATESGQYQSFYESSILGALLASDLGGPKITLIGKLADGTYFYEMEELFPEDLKSFNLKKLRSSREDLSPLLTDKHLRKMAQMLRSNLERRIFMGGDIDLMFSQNDVRWIDTGWKPFSESSIGDMTSARLAHVIHNYVALLRAVHDIKSAKGNALIEYLHQEINASKVWHDDHKNNLHQAINEQFLGHYEWSIKSNAEKYFIYDAVKAVLRCSVLF